MTDRRKTKSAGVIGDIDTWMRARQAEVRRLGRDAEAAAHEAWGRAARTGQSIAASTSSEVKQLGAKLMQAPKAANSGQVKRPAVAPEKPAHDRSARAQILAGARGAQDAFTFGAGDYIYAGARALGDAANGENIADAIEDRIETERARDAFDRKYYGSARTTGQVVGTGAQIALLGPAEGLIAGGARIPQATRLIAREVSALGGAGATLGLAGQAASDRAEGRFSSAGDYLGAAAGGAVGALVGRRGEGRLAGAAEGATTSLVQDLANGRAPSLDRARTAAGDGAVLGAMGGVAGRVLADGMTMSAKEAAGETVSRLRTAARGDRTLAGPKTRQKLKTGYTVPDQRSVRPNGEPGDIIESKFGRSSKLSHRQTQAFEQLPNYRVDQTLPRDIGAAAGLMASTHSDRRNPPRP